MWTELLTFIAHVTSSPCSTITRILSRKMYNNLIMSYKEKNWNKSSTAACKIIVNVLCFLRVTWHIFVCGASCICSHILLRLQWFGIFLGFQFCTWLCRNFIFTFYCCLYQLCVNLGNKVRVIKQFCGVLLH